MNIKSLLAPLSQHQNSSGMKVIPHNNWVSTAFAQVNWPQSNQCQPKIYEAFIGHLFSSNTPPATGNVFVNKIGHGPDLMALEC